MAERSAVPRTCGREELEVRGMRASVTLFHMATGQSDLQCQALMVKTNDNEEPREPSNCGNVQKHRGGFQPRRQQDSWACANSFQTFTNRQLLSQSHYTTCSEAKGYMRAPVERGALQRGPQVQRSLQRWIEVIMRRLL